MNKRGPPSIGTHLRAIEAAVHRGVPARDVFARLHEALTAVIGFKVLTVQKLDLTTLRSVRLYSTEPSYPVGGIKQHERSAWSETVLDRRTTFVARDVAALRAVFPDAAAIEAAGCGSIAAVPVIQAGTVLATMNLWHRDGYYDEEKGLRALPFAAAIAPVVRRDPSKPN
jgi:hypothetical protein